MAASEQPKLSDEHLAELEKLARAQERSVDEVLADAVDRYVKDKQWKGLKAYGREKARERGIGPEDVERLIAESRQEHGR